MLGKSVTCFNTQPPEGGWPDVGELADLLDCFNTQPPEGGWPIDIITLNDKLVSTHSRPKAAGPDTRSGEALASVSTHSRPKAAGCSTTLPKPN